MYSMLQRKFIVIILVFSVLFSGCIMDEDKGEVRGKYIEQTSPEEKFLNTMPGLFRGLSDNPLKENIIWMSSVPIGAEVYAANINDSFEQTFPSFSEINKIKYYKGTTPLALESNPGENFILLKVKAKRFENISSIKNYIQVVEGTSENRENFSSEDMWVDESFYDPRMYMTGEESKGNKIEYFYRAYRIFKSDYDQVLLIGLFQPENATYEELESLFPENKSHLDGKEYMPLEGDMIIVLEKANVSSSEFSKIIRIANWSGKFIYENDNMTLLIMSGFPFGPPGVSFWYREDIKKYQEEHKNSRN
jgi:hypothetical protein